jgi:hypothetical protein
VKSNLETRSLTQLELGNCSSVAKNAVTTGHDDPSSRTPKVLLHLHEREEKQEREGEINVQERERKVL